MAAGSDIPLGIATLTVRSGLMVIDRRLDLEDAVKNTGPRDGMSMAVACVFNEQSPCSCRGISGYESRPKIRSRESEVWWIKASG